MLPVSYTKDYSILSLQNQNNYFYFLFLIGITNKYFNLSIDQILNVLRLANRKVDINYSAYDAFLD